MDDISKVAPEQPKPVAAPLRGMLRNDAPLVVAASGGEGVEDGTVLWCFKIKVLQLQPPLVLVTDMVLHFRLS